MEKLLQVAKYLSSRGLKKEASQIIKMAQESETWTSPEEYVDHIKRLMMESRNKLGLLKSVMADFEHGLVQNMPQFSGWKEEDFNRTKELIEGMISAEEMKENFRRKTKRMKN